MKRPETYLFAIVVFLAGVMTGIGCEQWGLPRYPGFYCGPIIAGHTVTCPETER